MSQEKQVRVLTQTQELYTFGSEAQKILVPNRHLAEVVYEQENLSRYEVVDNDGDLVHDLGPVKGEDLSVVPHEDVLSHLLDHGFEIQRIIYKNAGVHMIAEVTPKPGMGFTTSDMITWDHSIWQDRAEYRNRNLSELLKVSNQIVPGHRTRYDFGLWRMICTNGLMSKEFNISGASFSPGQWSPQQVNTEVLGNRDWNPDYTLGKYVGTVQGLNSLQDLMVRMEMDDINPYREIPAFLQKPVETLGRLPRWFNSRIQDQFDLMRSNMDRDIHTLDVLCAVTNAVNQERIYGHRDPAPDSQTARANDFTLLIGAYSL